MKTTVSVEPKTITERLFSFNDVKKNQGIYQHVGSDFENSLFISLVPEPMCSLALESPRNVVLWTNQIGIERANDSNWRNEVFRQVSRTITVTFS